MLFKPISSVLIFTSTFHCILFISHETRTIDNDMLTIYYLPSRSLGHFRCFKAYLELKISTELFEVHSWLDFLKQVPPVHRDKCSL